MADLFRAMLADAPVGLWMMDEAAGATTAVDRSGGGRNGTIAGSATFGSKVGTGGASALAVPGGTTSWVSVPNDAAFNSATLTVEMFLYLDADVANSGAGKNNSWRISPASDGVYFYIMQSSGVYWRYARMAWTAAQEIGNYHHLVCSFDSSTNLFSFVWNGVPQTPAATGGPQGTRNTTDSNPLLWGNYPGFSSINGRMWGCAYYNTVLSPDRAKVHYKAALTEGIVRGAVVKDSFDRANNATSLGNADSGQAWTALEGTWGISGNAAYCPTNGTAWPLPGSVAYIDPGAPALGVQMDVIQKPVTAGGCIGMACKISDKNNFWVAFVQNSSGNAVIYAGPVVAGAVTYTIANVVALSGTGPWTIALVFDANNDVRLLVNGVKTGNTVTNNFNVAQTKCGIFVGNAGGVNEATLNNFSIVTAQNIVKPSAYALEVLQDSPTAYWPLDELTGTTASDLSGNGHNGTYHGLPILGQPGLLAQGVNPHLDGAADNVSFGTGYVNGNTSWSAEAWFASTATGIFYTISQRDSSANGYLGEWYLSVNAGTAGAAQTGSIEAVGYGTSNAYDFDLVSPARVYNDGFPHHLVMTRGVTSGKATLYVDGVQVAQVNHAGLSYSSALNVYGGYNNRDNNLYLPGKLGHLAIYPAELSASRVQTHYLTGMREGVAA